MEHAESPLGCEVHKARIGPTWDEYDFTNSRQRELLAPFLSAAFPPVGADVPLPPGVVVVDVLFQNLTTLIIFDIYTLYMKQILKRMRKRKYADSYISWTYNINCSKK